MIGAGLRALLLADATIAGLVGARVYPGMVPQGAVFPNVRYVIVSGRRFHSTEGGEGLSGPRLQIDCWATSTAAKHGYAAAHEVTDAIRRVLDGYKGAAGPAQIQGAFFETERDSYDPEAGTAGAFRVSADYTIYFEESRSPA